MKNVTLGGDRLGAGKKMKVGLRNYERSTHDLSYVFRSTMSSGTLVPFLVEVALPGDTFDIDLECDIKTHPTIGPLFGSYKVQLDVFSIPLRLYNSLTHNNMLGIGLDMSQVHLPVMTFDVSQTLQPWLVKDLDNVHVNPSCILAYLGIRGFGLHFGIVDSPNRSFNGAPLLMYWDIVKNYYANKQEGYGAVIHATPIDRNGINRITSINAWSFDPNNKTLVPKEPATGGTFTIEMGSGIDVAFTGAWIDPQAVTIQFTDGGTTSLANLVAPGSFVEVSSGVRRGQINYNTWNGRVIKKWYPKSITDGVENVPEVVFFDLDNIDTMRENILKYSNKAAPFEIEAQNLEPYNFLFLKDGGEAVFNQPLTAYAQEGLALKTYQSDLFNNWLDAAYMTYISNVSAVSTVGDSFTIDQLNLSKKVYDMLNRIAVSGGTYNDWIDSVYAIDRSRHAESPMYMGGLIKELEFQEVVSNAKAEGDPLGQLAGKGFLGRKHKGGSIYIRVDEPSYIMGLVSITPRIDYSQGNKWDVHLKTLDDLHKPALDEIGFQDLITEQMAWWDTYWDENSDEWITRSAGKQPAWINYMTNVNRVYGNFAIPDNEMFMTLNRRYEYNWDVKGILDLTSYIDPMKFNFIFAETALDAQNFWTQIGVRQIVRRKMSARIMPNL